MGSDKKSNKQRQNSNPLPEGHRKLLTRRDFISHGLIAGGAYALLPTVIGSLLTSSKAQAALSCPTLGTTTPGLIPFIAIDCAGGAGISGNLVAGSQLSGALVPLASYGRLGIPYIPGSTPGSIDSRFGAAFHTGPAPLDSTKPVSKMFEGITTRASTLTQGNTRMVSICHQSQDDSSNNELNPVLSVSKSGLKGKLIKNGLGHRRTFSGGNSNPSILETEFKPTYVSNVTGLLSSLSYGADFNAYPLVYKEQMMAAIAKMSQSQATKLSTLPLGDQFQNLVNCGYITNQQFASPPTTLDPRINPVMQSVFGITTTQNDTKALRAAIVYNALMGNAGPSVITVDGCDYHNSVDPTVLDAVTGLPNMSHGDYKDLEIGQLVGNILEAAAQLNKPVFIAVYSDGAVSSTLDKRIWTGDYGSASMAFMAHYRPTGVSNNRNSQLGAFTSGQAANTTPFFAKNPKFVSNVILANYLSVTGQLGLFPSLAPVGFLTDTATIDSIIGFG
jgi:hypothetical protein